MKSLQIKKAEGRLVKLAKALTLLEQKVDAIVAPPVQQTKQVPAFFAASFQFAWGDMAVKRAVIKNGGSDVRLHGFTYHASETPATNGIAEVGLMDTPNGLMQARMSSAFPGGFVLPDFEFAWDYKQLRDQQTYLNRANSFFPVSRESLGRRETQKHLYFEDSPQEFEAGGAIQFEVQPLAFSPVQNTRTIFLQMIAYGTRDGVMYEAP